MEFFNYNNYDNKNLDDINQILNETGPEYMGNKFYLNEMTYNQRKFINSLIKEYKPKKLLELGVSAGGSSALLLNAIKNDNDSFLYSIDYSKKYYRDESKDVGWLVNEKFSNLSENKWKLYTGGTIAKFIEEIGENIDFCLLDAAHQFPGELLDFLVILPYLKKNAIIVIHDTLIHTFRKLYYDGGSVCGILFASLKGKKFVASENIIEDSIGAVILDDDILNRIYDYFYLLTLKWAYQYKTIDIENIKNIFYKNYGIKAVMEFNKVLEVQNLYKQNDLDNSKKTSIPNNIEDRINYIENKLDKLINTLAWWIPNKKWRDNFRYKILAEQSRAEQSDIH